MSERVILIEGLQKTFAFGFWRRKVRAVEELSLEVHEGEIFGFLGPNGAGKTTTIKILMGLCYPTAGRVEVFGRKVPHPEAQARLGFLPENPYFYDYLSGAELLDLAGRLSGLGAAERRARAGRLLERVGLADAAARPLRKYSKGMLQRIGIAQALINDPKLVVLDEPMTGLDPIGRKEIRDLIVALKAEGKTVFFSTHILPDVELVCDRVGIIAKGRLRDVGPLDALLSPRVLEIEVVLEAAAGLDLGPLAPLCRRLRPAAGTTVAQLDGEQVDPFLAQALSLGAHVVSVTPRKENLEDLFMRQTAAPAAEPAARGAA
ncbi:MAG TPA: ABC transporter ATP-binding protein [Polyangia bacterium]|jgi:ABC-2 type transport system ATP-binding protein